MFYNPRCQAPRHLRQNFSRGCPRPLHTAQICQRLPHRRSSSHENQRRPYQSHNKYAENEILFAKQTNASTRDSALRDLQSQLSLPKQPNKKRPQEFMSVAILGGGITGLASAHYLARELPKAQITLYEGSGRLGGWLQSK